MLLLSFLKRHNIKNNIRGEIILTYYIILFIYLFNTELADTKTHMDVLAHMAPQNCFMLLNLFQKILSNRTVLPSLEDRLDRLCSGEALYTDLDDTVDGLPGKFVEILLSEKDNTDKLSTMPLKQNGHFAEMSYFNSSLNESMDQDALDSVYSSDNGSHVKSSQQNPSVLTAMHLLVSATDGKCKIIMYHHINNEIISRNLSIKWKV